MIRRLTKDLLEIVGGTTAAGQAINLTFTNNPPLSLGPPVTLKDLPSRHDLCVQIPDLAMQ